MRTFALLSAVVLLVLGLAIFAVPGEGSRNRVTVDADRVVRTAEASETASINSAPLKLPLVAPRIIVSKKERRLLLYSGGKAVRRYRVGLGFNPVGDKKRQGDGRTPEGKFYICQKNPYSKYYLSLGISYPGIDDARRGLREKLITREEHDRIVEAIEARAIPPWNTKLGGEVFIHGRGARRDWTFGCMALDDANMKELYDVVPEGTEVVINP